MMGLSGLKLPLSTTIALLTIRRISLALLLIGLMVRVITRPWKSETFFMN